MPAKAEKYFKDNIPLMDGQAFIFKTPRSGDIWQFRTYVEKEGRRFQRSLRTADVETAQQKARELYAQVVGDVARGKKLFGEHFPVVAEQWLDYQTERVKAERITLGRHSTIRTQVRRHIVPYVQEKLGKKARVGGLDFNTFYDYGLWRKARNPEVRDVTIRNETTTIQSLCRWAFRNGYITFDKCEFEEIKIREPVRRDTFTDEEYVRLYTYMREWVKQDPANSPKSNMMPLKKKQFFRDGILIAANSLLRVGELRQLKWEMVKKIFKSGKWHYAEIHLPAEICKNRKSRELITAGGEYFNRIKTYSNYTEPQDLVFCNNDDGTQISRSEFYRMWNDLIGQTEIETEGRTLTPYSLRHFGITGALYAGMAVYDVAKKAGTSVTYIEGHYEHMDTSKMLAQAKMRFQTTKEGWIERFERD
jgi:integrase